MERRASGMSPRDAHGMDLARHPALGTLCHAGRGGVVVGVSGAAGWAIGAGSVRACRGGIENLDRVSMTVPYGGLRCANPPYACCRDRDRNGLAWKAHALALCGHAVSGDAWNGTCPLIVSRLVESAHQLPCSSRVTNSSSIEISLVRNRRRRASHRYSGYESANIVADTAPLNRGAAMANRSHIQTDKLSHLSHA